MADVLEAIRKGGAAHEAGDPAKGPAEGTTDEAALFDDVETADDRDHKLRLLFKGTSLADVLAVTGGKVVDGDAQVSFRVAALGNREVGEVLRALFAKAHEAGAGLSILLSAIRAKAAGIDVKATLDGLTEKAKAKKE